MRNPYFEYPGTPRDRTFIGDWLMARPLQNECPVDVAVRAREGDEGAVIALLRIEGQSQVERSEDGSTRTIDCLRIGCDGCVKLIREDAGVEAIDCALRVDQPNQQQ